MQWPAHSDDEIEAVCRVLASGRTNYWTGAEGKAFEAEYAEFVGTRYAVALMNGTVALEAALYGLGIGAGDEVITSCRTFIASASSIVLRGAIPVLADVLPETQNISPQSIASLITPHTKAIIVVHLAGMPCDMPAILALAAKHHLKVIEDCAQAHGAALHGQRVGSMGDVGVFSFCQDKIISTGGEGGMLTTNDRALWERVWAYKDHGKSYDAVYHREHAPGFRWVHESFGTNWRMTEMQAAIGRLQLKKMFNWLLLRQRNAAVLTRYFARVPAFKVVSPPASVVHAYYKYYVFLNEKYLKPGWNRDKVLVALLERGVSCSSGSCSEIYREQAFKQANLQPDERRPVAKYLGETSLMFQVHPTLTEHDMEKIAETVLQVMDDIQIDTGTVHENKVE
jgi:hypothetical protein